MVNLLKTVLRAALELKWLAAGGILAFIVTLPVVYRFGYSQVPFFNYEPERLVDYEAFAPRLRDDAKHVIVGSCELALPIVGYDKSASVSPLRSSRHAWLGNILNFSLRNEYQVSENDSFYDMEAPGTEISAQTLYLYRALQVPNLKTLIYANGYGLSHFSDLTVDTAIELAAVLERMANEYPTATVHALAYKAALEKSEVFKKALAEYGEDWRRLIDPSTMTVRRGSLPPLGDIWKDRRLYLANGKRAIEHWFGGPARLFVEVADGLFGFRARQRDQMVVKELEWASRFYAGSAGNVRIQMVEPKELISKKQVDLTKTWFLMLAEITKAKGVKLAIYAWPTLVVSPENHEKYFQPGYTKVLADWFRSYDVDIIDHSVKHQLNQQDYVYHCGAEPCLEDTAPRTSGVFTSVIGRLRQSRMLIDDLIARGIVDGERVAGRTAWRGEASLRRVERCVKAYADGPESACIPWEPSREVN